MTKILNIFGGPGCGKSTTAAGLFSLMKLDGYNVELVTEAAKDHVWDESFFVLENQLLITAQQNHRLRRLVDKVDYVITDSPLLLGALYATKEFDTGWYREFIEHLYEMYDNIEIKLNRVKPYTSVGRLQTEDEAIKIDFIITDMLLSRNNIFKVVDGNESAPKNILEFINLITNKKLYLQ